MSYLEGCIFTNRVRKTSTHGILRPLLFNAPNFDFEAAKKAYNEVAQLIENGLANSPFLAGDVPTIADLFVLPEVDQLQFVGIEYSAYPNITRWLNYFKQQEYYQKNFAQVSAIFQALKGK